MTSRSACRHSLRVFSAAAIVCGFAIAAAAQPAAPRFLGHDEIVLYGIGLRVEPEHQTVPKDIATIVSTYLQTPSLPSGLPQWRAGPGCANRLPIGSNPSRRAGRSSDRH